MNIGIISHNNKKELIENFCIAYKKILGKHTLYATGVTGRRIEEVTNLKVNKFLPGSVGGDRQFMEMIEDDRLDMVIFFYNPSMASTEKPDIYAIMNLCDAYRIPMATNIATAEALIMALEHGDLEWRSH
ncbi:methylglyoxal synthase [Frisingicoccus sp.]|uniref:methylglyoxal synthase n=1 Tax=Frisingicoccus sp. TaxID=1918627 RepID=UPI002EC8E09E|nr:methylglyoxal synthase [Frisingicoccus sp.]